MKKLILSTCLIIYSFHGFSQNSQPIIDSLKRVIATKPHDSIKINVFADLCWYYRTISTDSAFSYGNKALNLSKRTKNLKGEAQAYNDIGILHYGLAEYPKSLNYYRQSLKLRTNLQDTMGVAGLYNKIGLVHQATFQMDSAIFYATKALKIYSDKNNLRNVITIKNNIANIYKGLKQYKKALKAHLEIAETNKQINDFNALTKSYNNIANAYLFLNDTLQSMLYYEKGIKLAEEYNYETELAALYNNYGSVLRLKGDYNKAIIVTEKALKIREKLNDDFGISSVALNLGSLYLDKGDINKAKNYLQLGLNLSKKTDAKELKMNAYDLLSSYYAYKKIPDSVIYFKQLFKTTQDSIFSSRITKEIAEVQEKYDTAEREKEIQSQRANIAEKELHINQKNTQIIGLGILALVVAILGYLFFNQQKLKNKQFQKESELKEALNKIESQNKLQEQRLSISRDLHDNIGAQLTFIISSIDNLQYGFNITNEALTKKMLSISDFTKETIYELRDTIWAMNKNDISLEDLQSRISNFIDKGNVFSSGINFSFNVDKTLREDLKFTSVKGMNIYRIIQEAINNAIKYAEASTIKVSLINHENKLKISIIDNGKGFDLNNVAFGNGLNNMKKRAHEIGSVLDIETKINQGTTIQFEV